MNLSSTFIKDRQSDKQLACVIEEPNIPPGAANLAPQITEFADQNLQDSISASFIGTWISDIPCSSAAVDSAGVVGHTTPLSVFLRKCLQQ